MLLPQTQVYERRYKGHFDKRFLLAMILKDFWSSAVLNFSELYL